MGDLISRLDAIDEVEDTDWYHQNKKGEMVHGANPSDHQAWYKAEDIYKVLESLPSADPEIIRCKDCRRYNGRPCGLVNWYNGKEDFCSRAERRTDERTD